MGDRGRGVALYGTAAAVLALGGAWWFTAAPEQHADPKIERWRASAEKLLPEDPRQEDADTVALASGVEHEVLADVGSGPYDVSVICVGGDDSSVRVSLGERDDSGRGLTCADDGHDPTTFTVSVAGQLRMDVNVSDTGPVIFRYSATPGS